MNVTLPDGQVIEGVPEGTTKAQLAQRLKANGFDVPKEWMPEPQGRGERFARGIINGPAGLAEAAGTALTGAAGVPLGGIAGLAGTLLPGPQGQGANWSQNVSEALTYQPRTQQGQDITGAVAYLPKKLADIADVAGGKVSESTDSPLAGTAANVTLQSIPAMIARGIRGPVTSRMATAQSEGAADALRGSVKDRTLADARSEGYVVPPSAVEPSFIGNRLESIGGKAALGQEAAIRNQAITNKIARKEAGLADDAPITEKTLADARNQLAGPYREVAAVSQVAKRALDQLKQVRFDAKDQWQYYNRLPDPKVKAKAEALDRKADHLETVIDREATALGRPDLLSDLQKARVALAKNYDVEKALNVGSGDIDARVIGRMVDKRGDVMTGGLATIGKFANAFSPYVREASKIPTPGVSKSEALAAGLFGMGTSAMGMGPVGAALPFLGGPARSLALSKLAAPTKDYQPGMALRLSDLATRNAGAIGLTPSLSLGERE